MEWSRAKTNRVLPREHTGHSKHPLPTTRDNSTHGHNGQYRNQIDYTLCSWRWRSSIQSTKTRSGADCDSGHEVLVANSGLNWRKYQKPFHTIHGFSVFSIFIILKNTEVFCPSLFQWTMFCQNSSPWPVHLGWPYMAWLRVSLS